MAFSNRTIVYFHCAALLLWLPLPSVTGKSWSLQTATFVPPASPSLKRSEQVVASAPVRPATELLAKKKTAPAAVKKIQVKMLKYLEGTGHVGEVVLVTPAFFNNKLRPTSSAVMISDEEVAKERAEAEALEKETNAKAESLKERMEVVCLKLKRKAGPDGQLFGGIGPKIIVDELDQLLADDFLHHKGVKIAAITDSDGKDLRGDIKHTGEFTATLTLTKDISSTFAIIVDAES